MQTAPRVFRHSLALAALLVGCAPSGIAPQSALAGDDGGQSVADAGSGDSGADASVTDAGPCQSNTDCPRGMVCYDGQCVGHPVDGGPVCTSDSDCGPCGECLNGGCNELVCSIDGGSSDAGSDAGPIDGGDAGVMCGGGTASSFPSFSRACASDADCTIGMHLTDCCGSQVALGIASSEASTFAADEAACESMYPACECFSGSVITDDGAMAPLGSNASAVLVHCVSSLCTTSVRPATPCDSVTCTPTQVCVQECSGIPLPPDAGPLPSFCVDVPSACATNSSCSCFGLGDPCPTGQCVEVSNGAPLCLCE